MSIPSDLAIAQAATPKPIVEIAQSIGLTEDDLELYGKYKAKIHLDVLEKFAGRAQGKYIDVTAITPSLAVNDDGIGGLHPHALDGR